MVIDGENFCLRFEFFPPCIASAIDIEQKFSFSNAHNKLSCLGKPLTIYEKDPDWQSTAEETPDPLWGNGL